jgi:hypothetical protein
MNNDLRTAKTGRGLCRSRYCKTVMRVSLANRSRICCNFRLGQPFFGGMSRVQDVDLEGPDIVQHDLALG